MNFNAKIFNIDKSCSSVVRHSSGNLKCKGSRLMHVENSILIYFYFQIYKSEGKYKVLYPICMFSYFLRFYISVLEIYISNLGARPVLVHFWEYIFWNWITVYNNMCIFHSQQRVLPLVS